SARAAAATLPAAERPESPRPGHRAARRPGSSASSLSTQRERLTACPAIPDGVWAQRARPCHPATTGSSASADDALRALLRGHDRRQPLPAVHGGLVGRAPGLEELSELLAGAVVVPFAVALDDFDEVVDRLLAAALAVQGDREIEACLMVEQVGCDLFFQVGDRADRFRLLRHV